EDVDDVGSTQPVEARQIERLVQHGPHVGVAPDPAEPAREPRVDRNEVDLVARLPEPGAERLRLDRLASQDVEARRHDRDPHGLTLARSGTSRNAGSRRSTPTRRSSASPWRRRAWRSAAVATPSAATDAT